MKLLHEIVRLCSASVRGATVDDATAAPGLRVMARASVPALTTRDTASHAAPETAVVPIRRPRSEPASFLKAPRHLHLLSGR